MGYLKLWKWIEEGRARARPRRARRQAPTSHRLSNRQQELSAQRDHFVSPRRVREWRDIHASCTPWWPSMAGG